MPTGLSTAAISALAKKNPDIFRGSTGTNVNPDGTERINIPRGRGLFGSLGTGGVDVRIPGQHEGAFRGTAPNFRGGPFRVGGDGIVRTPGQELEVRGLNDFIRSENQFRSIRSGLRGIADQRGLSGELADARRDADAISTSEEGIVERRTRTLGLTNRQQRAANRRLGLSRAITEASATSGVRRNSSENARNAAKAMGALEQGVRDVEIEGLTQLSNAAGQEKIRREQAAADKKSSRAGLFGTIAGAALSLFSSEHYKHDKRPVGGGSLLDRLNNVRVERWKYVGDETDHIGPYAEEFNDTFGVGEDNKQMIAVGDSLGVALGAIKELNAKVEAMAHGS